jgi:AraC-like DNA-binding protein
MKNYPIYDIKSFNCNLHLNELYINTFKSHLLEHSFIENSHRHNFYLLVFFTQGTGIHKIDLDTYEIIRGSLFILKPGQAHSWKLSKDIDGYIVFFNSEIYELYFGTKKIEEYPFYQSSKNIPHIHFKEKEIDQIEPYFKLLIQECRTEKSGKSSKLLNLIDIIHIEVARKHLMENDYTFQPYSSKMKIFNNLLEINFANEKAPSFYAAKMNISLKHLNRICKDLVNKTVTEIITQKVILESKRRLTFSDRTVSEISEELGYLNYSYFTRLFKKSTGFTPSKFRVDLKKEDWS